MSWRDKAAAAVKGPGDELTKPTKGAFVSNVSATPAPFSPETPANDEPDAAAEARKAKALSFLESHPNVKRACFADVEADPENIVLTVAVREPWGAVEVLVSRGRFDAFTLVELAARHPDTSLSVPEH